MYALQYGSTQKSTLSPGKSSTYLVLTISLQYRFKAPMANLRYTTHVLTLSQKHFFGDIYVTM